MNSNTSCIFFSFFSFFGIVSYFQISKFLFISEINQDTAGNGHLYTISDFLPKGLKILRRVFERKSNYNGENEELLSLYCLLNIIRIIKSSKMGTACILNGRRYECFKNFNT